MRTWTPVIMVASVVTGSTYCKGEPVLLESIDAIATGASAPEKEFRIEIVLANNLAPSYPPVYVGFGHYWVDGDSGVVDLDTNDQGFEEVSARLTDGVDQFLSTVVFVSTGGAGDGAMESQLFQLPIDLIGNELQFIRLSVHSVSIDPYDSPHSELEGIMWDVEATWEFWDPQFPNRSRLDTWPLSFQCFLDVGVIVAWMHRRCNVKDEQEDKLQ